MTEIEQWLKSQQDYDEGVAIFARHTRNKHLLHTFQRGAAEFHHAKLVYELGKLSGQPYPVVKATPRPTIARKPNPADVEIPAVILAAKKEIAHLYNTIDQEHNRLYECGTANDDKTVAKRKRILDKRLPIIARCDALYQLKEEYFRTEGAQQQKVHDRIARMLEESIPQEQPVKADGKLEQQVHELPDILLVKRQKQLASSITKTQNMLQYQSITKMEESAPLPDGPKRDQLSAKLDALRKEYDIVITEIQNRQQA